MEKNRFAGWTTVVVFLVLTGLVFSAVGCAIKQPTARIDDVEVRDVTTKKIKLDFIVGLKNPNPVGLTVNKLAYTLTVFDKPVVRDTTEKKIKIPSKANVNFKLPVSLTYADLIQAGITAVSKGKLKYTLALKITLDTPVGDLTLPVTKSGTIKIKSLADLLGSIEGTGYGAPIPIEIPADDLALDRALVRAAATE